MATVINNPGNSEAGSSNNSMGTIVVALVVLVIAVLFIFYGLPMLRSATTAPQINIPDKVDVNVQGAGQGK